MHWCGLVVMVLLGITDLTGASIAVAHESVPVDQLTREFLRNALLGRSQRWQTGVPVVLVLSRADADAALVAELSGRELGRLLRGWKRLTFSGGGAAPMVMDGHREVLERLVKTRGGVAVLETAEALTLPEGLIQHVLP
ncbi:MAG: hypothetical protein PF961_02280 [Planctomycetota bacterium]|jgi:hypothetical protein|nr:hypothetical protein [Planctomycetota bacterium]